MTATLRKPRLNDYQKIVLTRLRQQLQRAQEVCKRDHNRRPLPGSDDAYAFDFGALEECTRMVSQSVDELFGTEP